MNRNRFPLLIAPLAVLLVVVAGCSSYTYDVAKTRIEPVLSVSEQAPTPTKMSEIQAIRDAERAQLEAQQAAREAEVAQKAAEEARLQEAAKAAKAAEEAARIAAEQAAREEADEVARRAAEEAARIEAEKAEAERAEAMRLEAEQAAQEAAQEAARLATEEAAKLVAPVPSADTLSFPYRYSPVKETEQITGSVPKFSSLLIPLPDSRLREDEAKLLAGEIASGISDIDAPVLFITGEMQNIVTLVNQLQRNAILVPSGAIVTSFPIEKIGKNSVTVTVRQGKSLQLLIAYAPEYEVFEAFLSEPEGNGWKQIVERNRTSRLQTAQEVSNEASDDSSVLLGASLFEPSHLDWTSFSPVQYRSPFEWPMTMYLEEAKFIDGYRTTHYSEETAAGTTLRWKPGDVELQERIDYLYSRKLLPVETAMLSLGGLSSNDGTKIPNRYAIAGTYIVP